MIQNFAKSTCFYMLLFVNYQCDKYVTLDRLLKAEATRTAGSNAEDLLKKQGLHRGCSRAERLPD